MPRSQPTAIEIINRHVQKDPDTGCWDWKSSLNGKGYGQITFRGWHGTAHRFTYRVFRGSIKDGAWILHHCDNRRCVNPDHLYQGTPSDNRKDTLERSGWSHPYGMRSSCFAGHEYKDGTYRTAKDGSRVCRICMKQYMRNYRNKQKEI